MARLDVARATGHLGSRGLRCHGAQSECRAGAQTQNQWHAYHAVYQWQSGPTSTGPWTNVGTNATTFAPIITGATWFRCVVSCGVNAGPSTPVQITLGTCVPFGSTVYYLTNTNSTGGISNIATTGASPGGYGDY